jgi:hypothetical protein
LFYDLVQNLLMTWLEKSHPDFFEYWSKSTWLDTPCDRLRFGAGNCLTGNFYEYMHNVLKMHNNRKAMSIGAYVDGMPGMLKSLCTGRDFKLKIERDADAWRKGQVFSKSAQARACVDLNLPTKHPLVTALLDGKQLTGSKPYGITKDILLVPRAGFHHACSLAADPAGEIDAGAAAWLSAWNTTTADALRSALYAEWGGSGEHAPLLPEQSVCPTINFLSQFYMLGTTESGDYACSCPKFGKCATCKHVIGASLKSGSVVVPPEFDLTTIGHTKQGPGRPRTKRLLDYDDGEE